MLETSAEFHQLQLSCARSGGLIRDLHPHLIPNDDHEMRLKSYVLLCHAAFEEYLEKASLVTLEHAFAVFEDGAGIPKALFALASYYENPVQKNLTNFRATTHHRSICRDAFQWAIQSHRAALADVHGIRTHHQDSVFMPLGIKVHSFDHILSQALNSYGQGRGRVAHEFRIAHQHPRAACEQNVKQVIQLLLPFDQMLNSYSGELFML